MNLIGDPLNADAQIGRVTIVGDWIASSIAAGATAGASGFFGDGDDLLMSGGGVKDDPTLVSRVQHVIFGGQILGTHATVDAADHYGIVAQHVAKVRIDGELIALNAGAGNDDFALGITGDMNVFEV